MSCCTLRSRLSLLTAVIAAAATITLAQTKTPPAQVTAQAPVQAPSYEVASVRQSLNPNPRWKMSFTEDGLRATDVTLRWALDEAYGVTDDSLWSGGPAWLDKARFDIEAKYDVSKYPSLTSEQRHAMLQQLLADRFKLVVHREAKEFPLYALVVAKDGPKFEETKPEDLRMSQVSGVMCMNSAGRRGTVKMQGCTMKQFANNLGGYGRFDLGRKVVDHTGLTGHYTIALDWVPMDGASPSSTGMNAPDSSGPSIFTAVKEQLGLELKPIKGPVDTFVIDHAEMPTEN